MQDEGCRDERPPTTIFLAVVFHGDLVRKVDVLILRASSRSPLLSFKLWRRSPGSMSWNAVKCESWLRQSGFHNSSGQILGDARGGALPKTEHASNRTRHRRKNALPKGRCLTEHCVVCVPCRGLCVSPGGPSGLCNHNMYTYICGKFLHVLPPCTWSNGLPLLRADFRNLAGSPHQGSMFQVFWAEHGRQPSSCIG